MYVKKEVNPIAPSNNKRWTKSEDQILRQMVKEKATTAQVAIILGRTKASIWARKNSLGLDGRLSSSKGKGISAPTTLRTQDRSKSPAEPVIKSKRGRKPGSTLVKTTVKTLDFATLSSLAKASGARIVITFE